MAFGLGKQCDPKVWVVSLPYPHPGESALSAFRLASSTLPFAMLGQGLRGVLSTRLLVSHGGGCPAIPLLASWTLELVTFPLRRCHQDFDAVSGSAVLVVAGFEQRVSL